MFSHIIQNSHSLQDIFPYIRLRPVDILNSDLHILGLGSAGTHVAEYFFSKEQQHTFTSISCPPKKFIQHLDFNYKINDETLSDSSSEWLDQLSLDVSISEIVESNKNTILIAGLGGALGRELLSLCIEHLEESNALYTVLGIMPFRFEGKLAQERAEEFRQQHAGNNSIIYFENEDLVKSCGDQLMANTFNYANEQMFNLCKELNVF